MNKAKSFVADNKDSIMNAAKKALPGGAAEFMDIATKMSSGDTKGAALAACDLGSKYITDETGKQVIDIAKTAINDPSNAGIQVAMLLGKKAMPEEYHPLLDLVPEATKDPKSAGIKAAAFVAKKNLPPEAAKVVDLAAKIA